MENKTENPSPKRRFFSLAAGIIAIALGIFLIARPISSEEAILRIEGGRTFIVEVAEDFDEQYQGLSDRDSLPENRGMLFVYDEAAPRSFVMRGMRFNLDFIWIDAESRIISIDKNISPDTYPDQVFSSPEPAKYVFEINGGQSGEEGYEAGDLVEIKGL